MTIVYACDKNYAPLTAISAVSAIRHNPGARIVLLGYNLENDAVELVRSRVVKSGGGFEYRDISPAIEKIVEKGCCGYTSYAAYARIFIPEVLQESGRIIYLDGDTLVSGSLQDMLELDMGGLPFAFSVDCVPCSFKKAINAPRNAVYYNSGVMLMDLDAWRKHRCTERFLDEISSPSGINPLGDQDVFVRIFQGEIALLPPKWNVISHFFLFSYEGMSRVAGGRDFILFTKDDYDEAKRDPRIFHFLGNTLGRPWYTSSRHPMRERYRIAARNADLAEFAEQERPMSRDYILQWKIHRFLPQWMFDIVCNWLYRINIWRLYHV